MQFEWDQAKSIENEKKHGVSFEEAIVIWDGIHLEISDIAHSEDGKERNATMGWIGDRVFVVIWTVRGEKIRLISVRKARKNEEKVFFKKIQE